MDAKLEQMVKESIKIAKEKYSNRLSRVLDELAVYSDSDALGSSYSKGFRHVSTRKANFDHLELELKSVQDGAGAGVYCDRYRNVNFKGQCVLSFYSNNYGPDKVRAYIPGEWEAEFERAYLLAETRYNIREAAKAKEALREQELEDAELLKRFGLGPKS